MMTGCPIARLIFDERFWPRLRRDDDRVAQLVALLSDGVELPPVKIQKGTGLVLGGWHTVAAYQKLRRDTVPAEVVDVPDEERLLYAYREDATAALPYTTADVRDVARRLYQQRSNGKGANVVELARDLGRARQTVEDWLKDLIEADRERADLARQARTLAVHAFRAGDLSQRRIAELLGVDEKTVRNDAEISIAPHLADERVVESTRSLITWTAGHGATDAERRAAHEWLLERTNPAALHIARYIRALNHTDDWVTSAMRQLESLDSSGLIGVENCEDDDVQQKWRALMTKIDALVTRATQIKERTP
jgi:hypothetical protein